MSWSGLYYIAFSIITAKIDHVAYLVHFFIIFGIQEAVQALKKIKNYINHVQYSWQSKHFINGNFIRGASIHVVAKKLKVIYILKIYFSLLY